MASLYSAKSVPLPGLAILICTYQRPEALLRHLSIFSRPEWSGLSIKPTIYIYDDDPSSLFSTYASNYDAYCPYFNISYLKRVSNLGQGINFIHAVMDINSHYLWTIADDDYLDPLLAVSYINETLRLRPDVSISEFRQGSRDSGGGTFYEGSSRLVSDLDEAIALIKNTGKGSSAIFRLPEPDVLRLIRDKFSGCMYEDRPLQLFCLLFSPSPSLFLFNETVVRGDDDFGCLRYSMRVFANLVPVINYSIDLYVRLSRSSSPPPSKLLQSRSELSYWLDGLFLTLIHSKVRYRPRLFLSELFLLPVVLFRHFFVKQIPPWVR